MIQNFKINIDNNQKNIRLMAKSKEKTIPYSNYSYATEPTKFVRFLRVCFSKQLFHFFHLNLKIMKIVVRGHS
ncbi:MAG: hypothetical protein DRI94_08405 [Bacteroidetes bacterium]|nr:MAG: hypothetical protein DRI94_08405 [Bacteroidota bacterium]